MKIMRVKQQDGTLVDIPIGVDTASSAVSTHNTNTSAHADIREQISQLSSEKVDLSAYATKDYVGEQIANAITTALNIPA
jgi:hypothetical protein